MSNKFCLATTAAALAAALGFGLAWHQADQAKTTLEHYSRLVDQCRLQPDADLRLGCFDGTLQDQPG